MTIKDRFLEKLQYIREEAEQLDEVNKKSFVGKILRHRETVKKGWGTFGKAITADTDDQARKHVRNANRYDSLSKTGKASTKPLKEEQIDETKKPEDMISDFKDRQAYLGARKMQDDFNKRSRKAKGMKADHYRKMSDQHNDTANSILDKYRDINEDQNDKLFKRSREMIARSKSDRWNKEEPQFKRIAKRVSKEKRLEEEQQLDELRVPKDDKSRRKEAARAASDAEYKKGGEHYDETTKKRGKAMKSKKREDIDDANAEQAKMRKSWIRSIAFGKIADKKLEEDSDLD